MIGLRRLHQQASSIHIGIGARSLTTCYSRRAALIAGGAVSSLLPSIYQYLSITTSSSTRRAGLTPLHPIAQAAGPLAAALKDQPSSPHCCG